MKTKLINLIKNLSPSDIFKLIGLFYLVFLNIFIVKASPELIFLQLILFNMLLGRVSNTTFIKDWGLLIAGLVFYEFLRGFADNYSPFYGSLLFIIAEFEAHNPLLINITTFLKSIFLYNPLLLNICIFFYSIYFFYTFIIGYFIWVRYREKFNAFKYRFLLLTYIGLLFYFLVPTAPPWMYFMDTDKRALFGDTINSSFTFLSIYRYFVFGNPVAAYPSLHVGWTTFTSAFLVRELGRKYLVSFIIPIMVGISVIVTNEHWIIDVLAGLFFGILINYVFKSQYQKQS